MRSLLIDIGAAYRLTRLVTKDTLPPVANLRDRIVDRQDAFSELIECPWCAGMWISLGAVAARRLLPKAWTPLAEALAISGAVGLISHLEAATE